MKGVLLKEIMKMLSLLLHCIVSTVVNLQKNFKMFQVKREVQVKEIVCEET